MDKNNGIRTKTLHYDTFSCHNGKIAKFSVDFIPIYMSVKKRFFVVAMPDRLYD